MEKMDLASTQEWDIVGKSGRNGSRSKKPLVPGEAVAEVEATKVEVEAEVKGEGRLRRRPLRPNRVGEARDRVGKARDRVGEARDGEVETSRRPFGLN